MPFVRFSRDKRGYEYLYLIHVPGGNGGRGSAGRPRVLYWYRTPPGVKVGREPFDPSLRAALEAQNPDVSFDWKKILEAQAPPPPEAEPWRERRRAERSAKQARSAALRDDEPAVVAPPASSIDSVVPEIERDDRDVTASAQPEEAPAVRDAAPVVPPGEPGKAEQPSGRRRRRGGRHRRRSSDVAGSPGTTAGSDSTLSSDASQHDLQPGGTSPTDQPGETQADATQTDENQASEHAADDHQAGENVDETDAPWRSS